MVKVSPPLHGKNLSYSYTLFELFGNFLMKDKSKTLDFSCANLLFSQDISEEGMVTTCSPSNSALKFPKISVTYIVYFYTCINPIFLFSEPEI